MARLIVVVEGHGEEAFVHQMLLPHLAERGVFCHASRVEFARHGGEVSRGGLLDWRKADRDIRRWLKTHKAADVRFTTMFDVYGLPDNAPGRSDASRCSDPFHKALCLERAMGESIGDRRLLPYVQLHEFEALLLADASRLSSFYPGRERAAAALAAEVGAYPTPEHVDEGHDSAPSKRIIRYIPEYRGGKRAVAPIVLERIGLHSLRRACPHFGAWLACLERLASGPETPWPRLVVPDVGPRR